MSDKPIFFECTIPALTVNVYANTEQEAIEEIKKRLGRAAHILSEPSLNENHPGTGFVSIGYDSTAITAKKAIRAKLYVAAKVEGEALGPFFVRYDPLSGKPIGESDPE
jgi:hypothetical protein